MDKEGLINGLEDDGVMSTGSLPGLWEPRAGLLRNKGMAPRTHHGLLQLLLFRSEADLLSPSPGGCSPVDASPSPAPSWVTYPQALWFWGPVPHPPILGAAATS